MMIEATGWGGETALAIVAIYGALATIAGCDRAEHPSPAVEPSVRPVPSVSAIAPTSAHSPAAGSASPATPASPGWQPVSADHLCVTSGALTPVGQTRFSVDVPTFRAVTAATSEPHAQLRFTYLGQTSTTRALGSGAVRQQLGLKLRAQDPCNLVYVMWRIDPDQKLVVSIKQNPGQRTSRECGNRGYKNFKPKTSAPLPPLKPSSTHVLRADMTGGDLQVRVDDALVWEGSLGPEAVALEGPIGVRTDNVRIEAELLGPGNGTPRACGATDESE